MYEKWNIEFTIIIIGRLRKMTPQHNTEQNFNSVYEIWLLLFIYLWINKKTLILHIKVIYFLKTRPFHPQRKIFRTLPIGKVRLAWNASLPNRGFAYVFRLPELLWINWPLLRSLGCEYFLTFWLCDSS